MSRFEGKRVLGEGDYARLVSVDGWEYAERIGIQGIVVIVATTDDNRLLLVEQHRAALGKRVLELPAGLAGDNPDQRGEDLVAAAKRELLEETGYEAAEMEYLTEGPPAPGLCAETLTFYRASGLRKRGPGGGDETENIRVHELPLDQVESWLAERADAGLAIDPKIFTGLYFARRRSP